MSGIALVAMVPPFSHLFFQEPSQPEQLKACAPFITKQHRQILHSIKKF